MSGEDICSVAGKGNLNLRPYELNTAYHLSHRVCWLKLSIFDSQPLPLSNDEDDDSHRSSAGYQCLVLHDRDRKLVPFSLKRFVEADTSGRSWIQNP